MADWRQIQARIRKAKSSSDPGAQLTELFERTRDGMVAFELARLAEKAGEQSESVRWYTAAAERFRRAEWKKKAEEALIRLGAPLPAPAVAEVGVKAAGEPQSAAPSYSESHETLAPSSAPQSEPHVTESASAAVPAPLEGKRRRRRGRRGGRGRRHKATEAAGITVAPVPAKPAQVRERVVEEREPEVARRREPERPSAAAGWLGSGRAGEPALASRLAHLEAKLRRLLASPLYRLDDADQAPAGPGVFLLSDSDLTTSYYVESCKTLRIALGHLARGRAQRSDRRETSLRAQMAEHLGIGESGVSKYLKEHCVVRWIQLDDEALDLAHFAIAVLRPALQLEEM